MSFTNHLNNGLFPENFKNFEQIDKGAFGIVYKCTNNSRTYAVKKVSAEKANLQHKQSETRGSAL